MNDPIVNITDVFPNAVRIPVAELRDTDKVYDVYGDTHAIKGVRVLKSGAVSFKREGSPTREHHYGEITVERADVAEKTSGETKYEIIMAAKKKGIDLSPSDIAEVRQGEFTIDGMDPYEWLEAMTMD